MEGINDVMENFYYAIPGSMASRVIREGKGEVLLG